MFNQITVVIGPTGSGKSLKSIELAQQYSAEIISVDAFQVYKEFSIGTAKMNSHDQQNIPHHLLDYVAPTESYSVQRFLEDANDAINDIQSRGKSVIICGGTAMYLKALLYGYKPLKRLPESQRPTGTQHELWAALNTIDPLLAKKTPEQNIRRVQRYLELYDIYKVPPSSLFESKPLDQSMFKVLAINIDKSTLRMKIKNRVDQMMEHGWIKEVTQLMNTYSVDVPAFKAIGYVDVAHYINGQVSYSAMCDIIYKKTMNYAKRQMTWFKTFTPSIPI